MKNNLKNVSLNHPGTAIFVLVVLCALTVYTIWEDASRSRPIEAWHAVSGYYNLHQMSELQIRNESLSHSLMKKMQRKKDAELYTDDNYSFFSNAYDVPAGALAAAPSQEGHDDGSIWIGEMADSFSRTNVRTESVDEGDVVKTDGKYIYVLERDLNRIKIYRAENGKTEEVSVIDLKKYGMALLEVNEGLYLTGDRLIVVGYRSLTGEDYYSAGHQRSVDEADDYSAGYQKSADEADDHSKSYLLKEKEGYQGKRIDADGYYPGETKELLDQYAMSDLKEYVKRHKGDGWLEGCYGCTQTLVFDISDRTEPELIKGFFQEGEGKSRMSEGILYLFTERDMMSGQTKPEWDRPQTYVPKIQGKCMDAEDIVVSRNMVGADYLVLSSISIKDLDYVDQLAVLGDKAYLHDQYVSRTNLYLGWRYWEEKLRPGGDPEDMYDYQTDIRTKLMRISYEKGLFKKEADGEIAGSIKDDYCMDEKDGYLRLVCTYEVSVERGGTAEKNALYIFDENLELTGEITDLAGEEVIHSARFMGDMAYFVTYEQTDPLFAADLSDPQHPKLLSELKLPGVSEYLYPFGEGLLLGIGLDPVPVEWEEYADELENVVKLAMYDISDPKHVRQISHRILGQYYYSQIFEDPRSLFVDPKKGILGLNLTGNIEVDDLEWNTLAIEKERYGLYRYDRKQGFQRILLDAPPHSSIYGTDLENVRGVVIDDWFYICWPLGKPNAYKLEYKMG